MHRSSKKSAFTLVELILVIAILAIVSAIGVGKFGNLRARSAKRANIVNMQQIARAANTYIASSDYTTGIFNGMDALLDAVDGEGGWTGTPGTYDWTKNNLTAIPGIYMGPKSVVQISDASGAGADTTGQSLAQQRRQNQGTHESLYSKLGVYYLTEKDVEKLSEAGVSNYLLHNYTAGQAALLGLTQNEDGTPLGGGGGPGFRADMSAFYKAELKEGSPVAILNPKTASAVYTSLGADLGLTPELAARDATAEDIINAGKMGYRLICFGLGRGSEFALKGLDNVPRSEVFGKDYYRNYLLVFKQYTSNPSGKAVSFAGVIDMQGNTAEQARFNVDWYSFD